MLILTPQTFTIRMEVPQHRNGAHHQAGARGRMMEVAPRIEFAVFIIHQAVNRVLGAMRRRIIESVQVVAGSLVEFLRHGQQWHRVNLLRRPFCEAARTLAKRALSGGVIDMPRAR